MIERYLGNIYMFRNEMCCCLVAMSDSFVTPWTVAHQAPLSMGFPRQEYWSGLPFPSPGDLPDSVQEVGTATSCTPITPLRG